MILALSATLGFPRIGRHRELKKALESYWKNDLSQAGLLHAAAELRKERWLLQSKAGIDLIPSNDFSLYDHVLDAATMVGAVPERFDRAGGAVDLDTYFAMARGKGSIRAMEMTKWFDTNYHYIVPEFHQEQVFQSASSKPLDEFKEALQLGIKTVPVLLGPITFLLLGKIKGAPFDVLDLLPGLLPVYEDMLQQLYHAGADWVQIDEPCLVLDRTERELASYETVYSQLAQSAPLRILLATYFDGLYDNLDTVLRLPVAGIHIDAARAPEQLDLLLKKGFPEEKYLSLGLVDGRNVWKNDLAHSLSVLVAASADLHADRLIVAPSCSLLHTPWDLTGETHIPPEIRQGLAFATQKLDEITILKKALNEGRAAVAAELLANQDALEQRRQSAQIHNQQVKQRVRQLQPTDRERKSSFTVRKAAQQNRFQLPLLPTTTIGSFPQTAEVRRMRTQFRKGSITLEQYEHFLREETARCIRLQEEIGLDVLVHGEFERTDMVEYFGEHLDGFVFTKNGWVQSYGSRCVKPPIIYGDVLRREPMTVAWSSYAQSLTVRPLKGMLTGPITILQWSFVRNDQPREETCRQIALAIHDEVLDLESAGIGMIQLDEPALREGLPLRRERWNAYLEWAVDCFRLAVGGVRDDTQIHTHMCYAEFDDIMPAIQALDADVISMETSRSDMELLQVFEQFSYTNGIGPGVYDIHSPRVPSELEMENLLTKAAKVLQPANLWVNPDCGLKTRGYEETIPALKAMVNTAKLLRSRREF